MRERAPKVLRGPVPRNKEDDQVVYIDSDSRAAHPVLGRGSAARGPADRHARHLPEAAHRGAGQPGRRHPLRAQPPAGGRSALRAARSPGCGSPSPSTTSACRCRRWRRRTSGRRSSRSCWSMLDANGVDDVHIIVATCLHRKMTEAEMRRMVGEKIHDAFYPDRYYCHDVEDPDGFVHLGTHRAQRGGQHPPPRRRERPRHLREHQLRPHGRRPQVGDHRPRATTR